MISRSRLRAALKKGLERSLGAYGYRLLNPSAQFGVDAIADVSRLARLWDIDVALIFDVGANVGASSLAFRAAWPASEVIAFEPNGAVVHELRANVESVGRVTVEQMALGDKRGQLDFFVYENASVLGSLNKSTPFTERFGFHGEPISVNVVTLDQFCLERSINQINLLKIDAEGSDYDVLLGSRDLLENKRIDFIYCEFNSLSAEAEAFGSLLPISVLLSEYKYNFIASYNDFILTEGPFFSVSNALFAVDRGQP